MKNRSLSKDLVAYWQLPVKYFDIETPFKPSYLSDMDYRYISAGTSFNINGDIIYSEWKKL